MNDTVVLHLKKHLDPQQAEQLKGTFLTETDFDTLVTQDTDGYDLYGNLLFRYRKNAVPYKTLRMV